jgi:2-iminobutanoate/2-iminopropanoate deaminase
VIRHDPAGVTPPRGGYSHAVEVGPGARWLFVSGQIPERPDGSVPSGFREQCEAVWDNIEANLAAAGMSVANLIKVTTFLTDPDQTIVNREIRQRRVGETRPALTVVVARTLQSDWLLEIEAVAASDG